MRPFRKSSIFSLSAGISCAVAAVGLATKQIRDDVLYANNTGSLEPRTAMASNTGLLSGRIDEPACNTLPGGFEVCSQSTRTVSTQATESAELIYPGGIRVNQSAEIRLSYKLTYEGTVIPSESLSEQSVSVSGAGFEVMPSERRTLLNQETVIWSARAENTGPHNIVLNTSELFRLPGASLRLVDNDEVELVDVGEGEYVLPIMVYTVWNIPDWAALIIRWSIALVGFILTIPFLQDFFKWKSGVKN